MGIPVTVVGAVGDGVERGIGAMIGRETDGQIADQIVDQIVGLTADRMAGHGVAPVAAARAILMLGATTPKPGLLRGDAAKSAMGARWVGISCACMCATI
jgi:hypothetical protein